MTRGGTVWPVRAVWCSRLGMRGTIMMMKQGCIILRADTIVLRWEGS